MPLEDELCDILKKARTGQGLSVGEVARMTGLPGGDIAALERGARPRDRSEVRALAAALALRPASLESIALDHWEPVVQDPPAWVRTVQGSINGYAVNGYLLHDQGQALLIDTAYNPAAVLEALGKSRLALVGICLTHGHADHAEGIEQILRTFPVPVYLGSDDVPLLSRRPPADLLVHPEDGRRIAVGRRTVRCLTTPGHTPGGMCFRVDDPHHPVCFVGDTLFAGSIGRSNPARLYATHLDSVRRRVLTFPPDYRLYPGHGPATTVEEELAHNPFYTVS